MRKRDRDFAGGHGIPPPEPRNSTIYNLLVAEAMGSTPGCAFSHALNYNAAATRDDGSCTFSNWPPCNDPFADNFNPRSPVSYPGACNYTCGGIYATLKRGWSLHKDSPRARWVQPSPADLGLENCSAWPETPRCYTDAREMARDLNAVYPKGAYPLPVGGLAKHMGVFVLDLSNQSSPDDVGRVAPWRVASLRLSLPRFARLPVGQ